MRILKKVLIFFIRCYQVVISPCFPQRCRFYPTCSEYAITAINRYGPFRGTLLGILRILKCNPFHPGGYDPVK
ncbi:MAG TPA: membrane protein insertion efficiency factor YidD [Syntrophales bacterium]|nr:membrane protein insertion efficiency factor YidD [Syntrophales bacterium]HPQ44649.1 membrane protein insertion efficiency factor YidD [Syntrophales bacterium]